MICLKCKQEFVGESWQTLCKSCWSKEKTEEEFSLKQSFERIKNNQIRRLALINSSIAFLTATKKAKQLKEKDVIATAKIFEEWTTEQ